MIDVKKLLTSDQLWDYAGGVFPEYRKEQSRQLPIQPAWIPPFVRVPIRQHIGQSGNLIVKVGDHVLKGQLLTEPTHGMAVPVHAPTSGIVEAIGQTPSNHPSGLNEISLTIRTDGLDTWCERKPVADASTLSDNDLLQLIRYAGISGMGGAGFPTEIKLTPVNPIELLLINGAECEPYISADDTLMQALAEQVVAGIELMARLLNNPVVIIAIEADKPKAIAAMEQACADWEQVRVRTIPAKYPSGGERQLIQIITGQEVPSNGIPADLGVVVHNVGTAYAVARAVYQDEPLIARVVTITGNRVLKPANHWVLLGTPIDALLHHHGLDQLDPVIVGGPMMGYQLPHAEAPVIKTTNCLIIPSQDELPSADRQMPCIRCGSCAEACPANLLPQQLHWYALAEDQDKLNEHNLFDCIECGACAYVCPSEIPLVLEYRQAKAMIRSSRQEQLKAERAKQRFEARNERLEQEKQARAEKHKKAAEARLKAMADKPSSSASESSPDSATKQSAAVAAALARAKAKKASQQPQKTMIDAAGQTVPDNSDVAAMREARKAEARAKKAQKQSSSASGNGASDKSAAVAAAVARAKAKRQAQASSTEPDAQQPLAATASNAADDKAARVAAAVARAKAKRDAAQHSDAKPAVTAPSEEQPAADDKAARVAADVARAKAKRQAQQATDTDQKPQPTSAAEPAQDKAARIAQAVAKAKAKRAQQAAQDDSEQ
ncbi:electron transport complex subunit RsxC [Neiella sp. HB171785]|uniref:Ion-translocating oxidoreductase complex subunit C n=1 Tax=Neiella litorisoli TaxID=2771431 RepID=A0A8J6UQD0_9GAMM|nr:electron transport complex subunit RsxC [Neiella litorisoli]MBD1390962.1 electron transport complex subunit RsxC [Neiella litorisoli]